MVGETWDDPRNALGLATGKEPVDVARGPGSRGRARGPRGRAASHTLARLTGGNREERKTSSCTGADHTRELASVCSTHRVAKQWPWARQAGREQARLSEWGDRAPSGAAADGRRSPNQGLCFARGNSTGHAGTRHPLPSAASRPEFMLCCTRDGCAQAGGRHDQAGSGWGWLGFLLGRPAIQGARGCWMAGRGNLLREVTTPAPAVRSDRAGARYRTTRGSYRSVVPGP